MAGTGIKAIDSSSVHRITSGQVVIDLQTAIKELVENSLDAGATSIDIRFKEYGLKSIEVIDNGHGVSPEDYDSIALKHHTSKLASFEDLATVLTFGFRGEALSSLCALSSAVTLTTATATQAPMGTVLEFERNGKVKSRDGKVARQRGTSVMISGLFAPLPVRRKEFERNSKREYGKALTLLHAYALVPCTRENRGVRLTVSNHPNKGARSVQIRTDGSPSPRATVTALWGPKALDNITALDLRIEVEPERSSVLKKRGLQQNGTTTVEIKGLISKFAPGCGRTSTDRQFFYVNGRPCNSNKVQKAFNEVYRTFNTNQAPLVIADFQLPPGTCDINVSPDKRTIFIHGENNLVQALKTGLEEAFSQSRSTFSLSGVATEGKEKATLQKRSGSNDETNQNKTSELSEQGDDVGISNNPEGRVEDRIVSSKRRHWKHAEKATSDVEASRVSDRTYAARSLKDSSRSDSAPEPLRMQEDRDEMNDKDGEDEDFDMNDFDGDAEDTSFAHGTPNLSLSTDVDEELSSHHGSVRESEPDDALAAPSSGPAAPLFLPSPSPSLSSPALLPLNTQHPSATTPRSPSCPPSPSLLSPQPLDPGDGEPRPRKRARTRSFSQTPSREKSRPVQMVLGTKGAAWSLQALGRRGDIAHKTKSAKIGVATSARHKIRSQLTGFMAPGSQMKPIQVDDLDDDDDEDEDEAKEMDGMEPQREDANSMQDIEIEDCLDDNVQLGSSGTGTMPGANSSIIDLTDDLFVDDNHNSRSPPLDLGETTEDALINTEVIRTAASEVTLRLDFDRLCSTWTRIRSGSSIKHNPSIIPSSSQGLHASANVANADDAESAERELTRVIHKEDFASMDILGQFNLGFIIARRVALKGSGVGQYDADDLFIVDQHAADEKYNFETLQQTTRIESQKLFQPRPLELTAADELVAIENVNVLRNNGFEVMINEDAPAGQQERIRLVAQPVSKGTIFDMKDFEELLHLMRDQPSGQMVRCSKARAMFAMRACRKSVMVGMSLTTGQMTSVIRHMGTMDQPWNCPHGRPTMRHLASLTAVVQNDLGRKNRDVDWSKFVL